MDPQLVQVQATGLPLPTNHFLTTTAAMTAINHVGPGSAESSPKSSHHADWDEPLAALPGAKLRLMCSYGGHIIPRPHDKSLCYVGGETRMVVVERSSTLHELMSRLARTLLDGRQFTMKYQLPNEELDSLISVATDEDLENMVEEYDRIMAAASPLKPCSGRLRLFLFFAKPETAVTMGSLLDDAKSETWFVDALNGANMLPRGLSDSAAMDDLLSLRSGVSDPAPPQTVGGACSDASAQSKLITPQDVHSIQSILPDSPMLETTTSSYDSSTSSPSMAHLPPISVRTEENGNITRLQDERRGGPSLEEQLSFQLRVTPPLPTAILTQSAVSATHANNGGGDENNYSNRAISDDERSDHGVHVASRKPPLPLPLQPVQHRNTGCFNLPSPDSKNPGGYNLPSPDSVRSDSSIASATSFSKVVNHQEPAQVTLNDNNPPNSEAATDQKFVENRAPSPATQTQLQQIQDQAAYMYPPPPQQDQHQHQHKHQHQQHPQYIQQNMHYVPAHSPVPSYYPVYATQQSMQSQIDHQHGQYPVYILPVNQTQPYNMPVQPTDQSAAIPSSAVPPTSAQQAHQAVFQTRAAPPTNNNTSGMVQVAPNSSQYHQYVAQYNQQACASPMPGNPVNYGNYDYSRDIQQQQQHQLHPQVYYTGQLPAGSAAVPVAASQYQSMTPAQAAMIAEASMQLPTADSSTQPPRTS